MREVLSTRSVTEMLAGAGLRPTRQRTGLARLLFGSGRRHVTAEQLHTEAMQADMPVSLATVYNTLHQMTKAGLLREVVVAPGRSYFDTNISEHHHFFHEGTGRLTDIAGEEVTVSTLPEAPSGTRVKRVEVIVRIVDEARGEGAGETEPRQEQADSDADVRAPRHAGATACGDRPAS